ncbi:unnamed protein product [Durusdinium trenchii]|uniref:EamA domain-containing protein n=2 Tax=Durusdinium trenchii TaxID=1381693 RepID=A0ABP0KFS5_9DINO
MRLAFLLLCTSVSLIPGRAEEACDFDDSTLLQLEGTGKVNRSRVAEREPSEPGPPGPVPASEALIAADSTRLRHHDEVLPSGASHREALIQRIMTKIRAARSAHNGMLFISGMLVTVLLWGEVTHAAWLQGRSAAILSAFTLVASNVLAKTLLLSPQFGIGVLDLIYSHCLSLAFLGALFTKLHPEKPLVVPDGAEQAVQALSVGFFSSACSMLLLGGLYVGPATAVLLVIALQSSIATLWKHYFSETIEAEEHLAAPLLLIAVLVGTVIGAREEGGEWMWSAFFGLCAAVGRATCALQQRNFACQMHHVVTVTYAGIIGLIMFGPIAAAYPQHARAILTMEMHNLAPLVLFGVLSLMSTLGMLKAANSMWGTMSESSYTLVSGLSLCLQFVADLTVFSVNWARFTQSSIALAATCMIFSYAVSYKQVLRAEQCFTSAYSLFEPQNFEQGQ